MKLLFFILGSCLGSFSLVVAIRRKDGRGFVFGRSKCDSCKGNIPIYFNIPIISYIYLKGKCPYCKSEIPKISPLVEIYFGLISLFIFSKYGFSYKYAIYTIIFLMLNVVLLCDVLENNIYIVDLIIVFAAYSILLAMGQYNYKIALINCIVNIILFSLINFISKGGMGQGDMFLAAVLGYMTKSYMENLQSLGLSFILGAAISLLLILAKKKNRKDTIAFGPFLVISYFINILFLGGI